MQRRLEPQNPPRDLRYSDEPLTNPAMIVADSMDRFFVSDRSPARIVQFASNGRFLKQIGREGRGPGEYVAPSLGANARRLIVHDAQLSRLSVFTSAGSLLWTKPGTCCGLHRVGIDQRSRIYVLSRPMVLGVPVPLATVLVFDSLGALVDSTHVPNAVPGEQVQWRKTSREAAISVPVPFTPTTHYTVTPTGTIVFGYSNEYALHAGKGVTQAKVVVRRSWVPAALEMELRTQAVNALVDEFGPIIGRRQAAELFNVNDIPKTGQAFYGLESDACGRIWVLKSPPHDESTLFDVYDAEFRYVDVYVLSARLSAPPRFAVGQSALAAIVDDDQGAPRLAVAGVRLRGRDGC